MMTWPSLMILTSFLTSIQAGVVVGISQNQSQNGNGRNGICVEIPSNLSMCQGIGYSKMRLPNLFHHETLQEVSQQAVSWIPLSQLACHPDTNLFLCSLFTPVCLDQTIPPCRSLCRAVKEACQQDMSRYGYDWPQVVRCDQFPVDNDMCIEPQHQKGGVEGLSPSLSSSTKMDPEGREKEQKSGLSIIHEEAGEEDEKKEKNKTRQQTTSTSTTKEVILHPYFSFNLDSLKDDENDREQHHKRRRRKKKRKHHPKENEDTLPDLPDIISSSTTTPATTSIEISSSTMTEPASTTSRNGRHNHRRQRNRNRKHHSKTTPLPSLGISGSSGYGDYGVVQVASATLSPLDPPVDDNDDRIHQHKHHHLQSFDQMNRELVEESLNASTSREMSLVTPESPASTTFPSAASSPSGRKKSRRNRKKKIIASSTSDASEASSNTSNTSIWPAFSTELSSLDEGDEGILSLHPRYRQKHHHRHRHHHHHRLHPSSTFSPHLEMITSQAEVVPVINSTTLNESFDRDKRRRRKKKKKRKPTSSPSTSSTSSSSSASSTAPSPLTDEFSWSL